MQSAHKQSACANQMCTAKQRHRREITRASNQEIGLLCSQHTNKMSVRIISVLSRQQHIVRVWTDDGCEIDNYKGDAVNFPVSEE